MEFYKGALIITSKDWHIGKRITIRYNLFEWLVGISFNQWTWIHIPMFSLCVCLLNKQNLEAQIEWERANGER